MRKWILFLLIALALTACATAATEAPPLPTVAETVVPPTADTQQTTGQLPDATDPPTLVPPTDLPQQPTIDTGTTTGLLMTPVVVPTTVPEGVTPVVATLEATVDVQQIIGQLPPPGTAFVAPTEEVRNPEDLVSPFYTIYYVETGGPANSNLEIEIFGDGRVIRNGAESTISAETIEELNQLIRDVKFFSIQGQFTQPGGVSSDSYAYSVRVELETGSATRIDAHDRLAPPELLTLFSRLRTIGL